MRKASRLVTSRRRPSQTASRFPSSGAASTTCSKLSRSKRSSRSAMCEARSSLAPRMRPIVSRTRAESRTSANPIQKTPARKLGTSSVALSIATRVFPDPPGPLSVTSRASPRRSSTASPTSRTRPTNELAGCADWCWRSIRAVGVAIAELEIEIGSVKSLTRCSPRSRTHPRFEVTKGLVREHAARRCGSRRSVHRGGCSRRLPPGQLGVPVEAHSRTCSRPRSSAC